jgi:hypothetical protein
MTIYYRSKQLVITDRAVIVLLATRITFPVAELSGVHAVHGKIEPRGHRPAVRRTAGGAFLLVMVSAPVLDSPGALAVTLATVATLTASAAISGAMRSSELWELRAVYRNTEICLFSSTDAQTFGQVKRAMMRTLEANERW